MHPSTYFITWTTYGTWLPGDDRGWKKWRSGNQPAQPRLETWCRNRMKGEPIVLDAQQRRRVKDILTRHAEIRGWFLHAVSVRSNHVHVVVTAEMPVAKVRDQLKANATRVLRQPPNPLAAAKIWTRGGDTQIIDGDLEAVINYVTEAQERMARGK